MRKIVTCLAAIVAAVALLMACNSDDSHGKSNGSTVNLSTQTPADGVRRITVTELNKAVAGNAVVIVDVRSPEAYDQEHIKGSINIPETSTDSRAAELPRDKMIVLYCS